MKKPKKVLAFAKAAGGAAAIIPVCQAILQEGWGLLLLAKDEGLSIFEEKGMECVDFPSFDNGYLDAQVNKRFGSLPDLIFTSATTLPTIDMTEKYLWKWGKQNKVMTIGLLDQWQDYTIRFSGCDKNEKLTYLPDYIFVMDKLAKKEMVKEGISEELIIVTGQPAFDRVVQEHNILFSALDRIKDKINIPQDSSIITFVAEALKKDFGNSRGYDEQSILRFLGNALEELCIKHKDSQIYLAIKPHPENKHEEFDWVFSTWPNLEKRIIGKELCSREVVAISDLIVGMSSVLLLEAILANKIVLSLQLNSLVDSQLVATKVGAIPFIKSPDVGKQVLNSLLHDTAYKKRYLERQKRWKINTNSTQKCLNMLREIAERNVSLCDEGSRGF